MRKKKKKLKPERWQTRCANNFALCRIEKALVILHVVQIFSVSGTVQSNTSLFFVSGELTSLEFLAMKPRVNQHWIVKVHYTISSLSERLSLMITIGQLEDDKA